MLYRNVRSRSYTTWQFHQLDRKLVLPTSQPHYFGDASNLGIVSCVSNGTTEGKYFLRSWVVLPSESAPRLDGLA